MEEPETFQKRSVSKESRTSVSSNHDEIKERLRGNLVVTNYSVTGFYHTKGFCQRVARDQRFESLVLGVISFNALWIWIDVDYNKESTLFAAEPVFIVAELFFCVFFSFEWIVRFGSFRRKCDTRKDGWFMFDTALVTMMVGEITLLSMLTEIGVIDFGDELGKASILRLLRLLRLTRIGKLMAYVPEMLILIKGMAAGVRSVGLTMLLLGLIIYVVAVAMKQLADGTSIGVDYFSSVPQAMYTLLINGMIPDNADSIDVMKQEWYIAVMFVVFVFFSIFCVLNMLIGILCEIVSSVKSVESEQMDIDILKLTLKSVLQEIDVNHDGMISKAEFLMMFDKPRAIEALNNSGFDIVTLVDYADILFPNKEEDASTPAQFESTKSLHGGLRGSRENICKEEDAQVSLTFIEFIQVLLRSRRSQGATQRDVRELQKFVKDIFYPRFFPAPGNAPVSEVHPGVLEQPAAVVKPPTDATDILTGLSELMQRVDGLETIVATSLDSQPQLEQRMSMLEAHFIDVKAGQKEFLDRLPSLDLLASLGESMMPQYSPSEPESVFTPSPVRYSKLTASKRPAERDLKSCHELFYDGCSPDHYK